ncbi:MAG TPA: glycosyltransferase [Thermoanaerobaculia bacterium]|jgi:lipopolysaccharide biosynthesis glycosyltransferase
MSVRARESLDVAICIDRMHFVGVVPTIRSILANAGRPQALAFHVAVGAGESDELLALLRESFPDPSFRYEVREFRCTPFLDDYVRAGKDRTYAAYTSSVMNFARFYLGVIYPELGKYAYLDVDVIVQGDLAELFREATLERHDLAAVRVASFGTWEGGFKKDWPHLRGFDPGEPVFNNGIYVTELARWRKALPRLEHWMRVHRRSMEDVVFGTQSIMNLAFYRNVQLLPPEWNVRPLGYDDAIPERTLREAKILHWAGERKPWKPDGLYKEYWTPYAARPAG